MFKRVVLVVVAIALLVPVGLTGIWIWSQVAGPVEAQTAEYSPAQTITVLGQGSARVEPDIARVSIGVETMADTISEAVNENETKMESILAALEKAGVEEKDIQTSNYSVQLDLYPEPLPREVDTGSSQPKPQYRVSNMVNVTIRDLDKIGDVLDAALEAGANNIWGVNFGLEDSSAAEADARANAIADAGSRAEALASLSKVELGPVMSVSEVIGGGGFPMPAAVERAAAVGAGPISPGELEVNYQVQVTYFIAP